MANVDVAIDVGQCGSDEQATGHVAWDRGQDPALARPGLSLEVQIGAEVALRAGVIGMLYAPGWEIGPISGLIVRIHHGACCG